MPPRQTRRTRRRVVPPTTLPRPSADEPSVAADDGLIVTEREPAVALPRSQAPRRQLGVRTHHVEEDLSYVRTDLIGIAVVASICLAFVVGASFLF